MEELKLTIKLLKDKFDKESMIDSLVYVFLEVISCGMKMIILVFFINCRDWLTLTKFCIQSCIMKKHPRMMWSILMTTCSL